MTLVTVTLWNEPDESTMLLLAGQHLACGVQKIQSEREQAGLRWEHWQRYVLVDIKEHHRDRGRGIDRQDSGDIPWSG